MQRRLIMFALDLPADFDHIPTLEKIRELAAAHLAENASIRTEIVEQNGEQVAIDEWDAHFAPLDDKLRQALKAAENRLTFISAQKIAA